MDPARLGSLTTSERKREQIVQSVEHYKHVLKKWEAAVSKGEGRKPDKNDLRTAPDSVQKAYKQYYKLRKYLDKTAASTSPQSPASKRIRSDGKVPSPHKIFFGRRNPSESPKRKSPFKASASPSSSSSGLAMSKSRGILKRAKNVCNPSTSKYFGNINFNVFKEKISFALNTLEKSKVPSPVKQKKQEETVDACDSESENIVNRKILAPTRPSRTSFARFSSMPVLDNRSKPNTATPTTVPFSRFQDEPDRVKHPTKFDMDESSQSAKLNRVSAVWHVVSPNPKLKMKSRQEVKKIDSAWLTRCSEPTIDDVIVPPTPEKETDIPISVSEDACDGTLQSYSSLGSSELGEPTLLMDISNCTFGSSCSGVVKAVIPKEVEFSNCSEGIATSFPTIPTLSTHNEFDDEDFLVEIPTPSKFNFDADEDTENNEPSQPLFCPAFKNFLMSTNSLPISESVSAVLRGADNVNNTTGVKPTEVDSGCSTMSSEGDIRNEPKLRRSDTFETAFDEVLENAVDTPYDLQSRRGSKNRNNAMSLNKRSGRVTKRKTKDGNFVKIDIKKKVFVRGYKKTSAVKAKRNEWKMRKAAASKEEKFKNLVCRKCGESGHFQKFCRKDNQTSTDPSTEVAAVVDDSPFPTLQETAIMVNGRLGGVSLEKVSLFDSQSQNNKVDEETTEVPTKGSQNAILGVPQNPVQPFFLSESSDYDKELEEQVLQDSLQLFGYKHFRPGQKEAVKRILGGLSTLCVLSTGSGKSLCYQLPAYLYAKKNPGSLAICISPLVSLMEDQVQGVPHFLEAAFLHSNMPNGQKEKVIEKIRAKKLHILLVSPEAICGGMFGLLRGGELPPISFACIDEVHCVSQWSHNFRPCYLQLHKILREKLRINTILGLTATATEYTANSICENLQIDPLTTIRGEILPNNLHLSSSRDALRDEALLTLLRGERFKDCESIIVYCTRREECTRVSSLIRTCLQASNGKCDISSINSRQRVSNTCEAYHAGMSAGRRRLVQQQFMSGKIRIVVATVAFGMGIDKSDIRAVIHYNMPKTFESYVQEIGRAGRDGQPAQCHLFLDSIKGRDLSELKRHVYSNSVDRPTIRKLIRKVFQPCKCQKIWEFRRGTSSGPGTYIAKKCPGHEVSFCIEDAVQELDLPAENISTMLCYLELDKNRKWVEMLPNTYEKCKIQSYGGVAALKAAARKCPPLGAAIALLQDKKEFKDGDLHLEFNVIEISATLGWNSFVVKKELKNLEWTGTEFDAKGNAGKFRKSGILVEFTDLAFHLNAPGDLSDEDFDRVLNYLYGLNQEQEKSQLYQLHRVYQALLSISSNSIEHIAAKCDEPKSQALKVFIQKYFLQRFTGAPPEWKNEVSHSEEKEDQIRHDIRSLLASVRDTQFTGRSVAKIFQGIPSPCFPSEVWGRNRAFWRKHFDCDFHYLCKIAGQEILHY